MSDKTTTIPELFLNSADKYPEKTAITFKKGHRFENIPYKRLKNLVGNFVLSFEKMGLKPGDRLVLISENRPEWVIVDLAAQFAGAITVPIHKILTEVQIQQIIAEVEPKIIVVSDRDALDKILMIQSVSSKKVTVIYLEESIGKEKGLVKKFHGHHFVSSLKIAGHYHTGKELEIRAKSIKPVDVASIIYTSGTTGKFKGVELKNENFVSDIKNTLKVIDINEKDKFLSVLPLSHVFERTCGCYAPLYVGGTIAYIEDVTKVSEYAKTEKPTVVLAVPRLYEKVYEKVMEAAEKSPIKKALLKFAVKYGGDKENRKTYLYDLLDKVVYSKIRQNFGGHLRFFVSGAASLAPWLGEFMEAVGITVLEGYGLTENSPIISCNRVGDYRFGTVGRPIPGIEVQISSEGEILVKGPTVMKGYYKNPEATKETFTKDGWLKTGDLGSFDKDGFLTITGRIKEMIVLNTGKKIFPGPIEEALQSHYYVDQAFIFGDGHKHIAAIIVPSGKAVAELGEEVEEGIQKVIDEKLSSFSKIEQVKKFILSSEPFSIDNGTLTPTLKLRRLVILEKFADPIKHIYMQG